MALSLRRLLHRVAGNRGSDAGPPPRAPSNEEQRDRLTRLEELKDQGLLTESEFAEQRHRILGE